MTPLHTKMFAIAGLLAALLPVPVMAQDAVALSPSLLEHSWVVADFEGKQIDSERPTFQMADDNKIVIGQTQCGTEWNADTKVNFPRIEITNVQTGAFSCDAAPDVNRFLLALEKADRFNTSPDGLELLDKDGQRIALMVAGS